MIPTDVSGSRLPGRLVADQERRMVDDGARDRDALLLAAGELVGPGAILWARPTRVSTSGTLRRIDGRRLALHPERVRDVLGRGAVGRSLKSWKTQPTLRRSSGTFECLRRAGRARRRGSGPHVGSSSFRSSRMIVDLPEPDGADDEHELALVDHERDAARERRRSARRPCGRPRRRSSTRRGGGTRAVVGTRPGRRGTAGDSAGWREEIVHDREERSNGDLAPRSLRFTFAGL